MKSHIDLYSIYVKYRYFLMCNNDESSVSRKGWWYLHICHHFRLRFSITLTSSFANDAKSSAPLRSSSVRRLILCNNIYTYTCYRFTRISKGLTGHSTTRNWAFLKEEHSAELDNGQGSSCSTNRRIYYLNLNNADSLPNQFSVCLPIPPSSNL